MKTNKRHSSRPTLPSFARVSHPDVLPGLGKVTAVLGEGGVAWVYEVFNGRLCAFRAVKLLKKGMNTEIRRRFEQEAGIVPHLTHPSIMRVFSTGEIAGQPYIEMERFRGVSLDVLLSECGALPYRIALAVALSVCDALSYSHAQELTLDGHQCHGVLHRDLKPANIMIGNKGAVKLTDFGAARPAHGAIQSPEQTLFGSLQYVSPEDLRGDSLDVRTDIYSFGCVLYEALTGERMFPQATVEELLAARKANHYAPLTPNRRAGPRRLRQVVDTCLCQSPDKRYASTDTLSAILRELADKHLDDTPEHHIRDYLDALGRPAPSPTQRITRAIAKVLK